MFADIINILIRYREAFLKGVLVTLELSVIIWIIGVIVGTLLGFFGSKSRISIGIPSKFVSFFLSGIPVLVLLFWIHYPLQTLLGLVIDPFYTTIFTLTFINVFSVSDLVRNALLDFPAEYIVSAKVCGLSSRQTFKHIQLPIILRQVLPSVLLIQVNMLQITLFASLISVDEIFRVAQQINAIEYKPVEIYSTLAIFYLIISLPLNGLAIWLKNNFTRNISDK